jgi:cobalt-precorrin 5A hydrolase
MAVAQMIAVGIGCRTQASADAIVALIEETLSRGGDAIAPARLATIDTKANHAGLIAAAARLQLPLLTFSREALAACASRGVTRSDRVMAMHGVPSVAETAALAAAGQGAVLLVPRIARDGVTCAIARGDDP